MAGVAGQSTDSDLSSPDGSPEITRKKRIWERAEKDKESYADMKGSGKSADDIMKKSKKASNCRSCSMGTFASSHTSKP